MRAIDADELWEKMYRYNDNEGAKMPYGDDDSLIHKDSACFLIENAPTIEPQPEIVRCEHCVDWQTDWDYDDRHYCATMDNFMLPTDFCSYGDRRQDG